MSNVAPCLSDVVQSFPKHAGEQRWREDLEGRMSDLLKDVGDVVSMETRLRTADVGKVRQDSTLCFCTCSNLIPHLPAQFTTHFCSVTPPPLRVGQPLLCSIPPPAQPTLPGSSPAKPLPLLSHPRSLLDRLYLTNCYATTGHMDIFLHQVEQAGIASWNCAVVTSSSGKKGRKGKRKKQSHFKPREIASVRHISMAMLHLCYRDSEAELVLKKQIMVSTVRGNLFLQQVTHCIPCVLLCGPSRKRRSNANLKKQTVVHSHTRGIFGNVDSATQIY